MATSPSILAWRIPWTEESGGLQFMGSQRLRHYWMTFTHSLLWTRGLHLRIPSRQFKEVLVSLFCKGENCNSEQLSKWPNRHECMLSCVQPFAAPWTVTRQAPLFMGFPRQECWSALPFPSLPGNLLEPGIESMSPAVAGRFFTTEPPGKPMLLKPPMY